MMNAYLLALEEIAHGREEAAKFASKIIRQSAAVLIASAREQEAE